MEIGGNWGEGRVSFVGRGRGAIFFCGECLVVTLGFFMLSIFSGCVCDVRFVDGVMVIRFVGLLFFLYLEF